MRRIAYLILILFAYSCFGGMRREPIPHAITSPGGHYVFTMIPGPKGLEYSKGYGVCYHIMPDSKLKEIWRVEGWYSENLQLHYDGEVLVRIGSWESGDQDKGDSKESLAVAFYKTGKPVKSYKVSELIKDQSKLQNTTAGLWWLKYDDFKSPTFNHEPEAFQLITLDGIRYQFDIHSGRITGTTSEPAN